jgi:microsomal dipeptidase-like Zn-dependent dipeptidase
MPYFDLHCHPGLKTLFLPQNGSQLSAWHTIGAPDIFGDILSSQSSLEQLTRKGEVPLLCLTLHPPESGMIDQFVIIAGAILLFRQFIDPARLQQMYSGTDGYRQVFAEELANLMAGPRAADAIPAGHTVKFLKSWKDFDPADPDTLHVVFNIEGGHALYDQGDQLSSPQAALDNLTAFLDKGFLTLYITPTHLTPNAFITHAYGNKILTKGPLLPKDAGITVAGKALIDLAYNRGLLIDIKHMSPVSRQQFFLLHKQYYPDKPILASHAGFTGMSLDTHLQWVRSVQPMGKNVQLMSYKYPSVAGNGLSFYPLTINLFMEDILAILASDGLIGISMDVRILGGKETVFDPQMDYLSAAEYAILDAPDRDQQIANLTAALANGNPPSVPTAAAVPDPLSFAAAIAAEAAEFTVPGAPADQLGPDAAGHALLIANHLVYLVKLTYDAGLPLPWGNICIGSDFDGLIEAVDCCKNATQYSDMAGLLVQALRDLSSLSAIPLGMDAAQIVDQFCYTNALNFLNRHFR